MKHITFICLLCLAMPLLAHQYSLTTESSDREGLLSRAYVFQSWQRGDWSLQNSLVAKWTQDDGELEQYYLRNFARDRLTLIRSSEPLRLALHAGGEYYYGENVPTHIAGLADRWDITKGVFGGVDATAYLGPAELRLRTDWWGQWFEPVNAAGEVSGDEELDTDLWSEGRAAWRVNDWAKPYIRFERYDDLNELDTWDELTVAAGNEVNRKLSYIHTLRGTAEVAWSNTFDNEPWSAALDARLSSKFGLAWMLVNRVSLRQVFTTDEDDDNDDDRDDDDEDDGESNEGGSLYGFYEVLAQRVLKLEGNHLSRVQMGGRAWAGDESGYIEANLLYWLGRFNVYLDAEKHFEGYRKHRLTAQLGAELWQQRLQVSCAYQVDDRELEDDVSTLFMRLELML